MAVDIILVMKPEEYHYFSVALTRYNPNLQLARVERNKGFDEIANQFAPHCRIISFSTFVIVPAHIIQLVQGNCYNMHPAPAKLPGFDPIGMALYHNMVEFGVVLHKTMARVDSGAIVAERKFAFPAGYTREQIAIDAYKNAVSLTSDYCHLLAFPDQPLPINPQLQWDEQYRSSRQLVRDMQKTDYTIPIDEQLRRYAAFGDCNPEAGLAEINS